MLIQAHPVTLVPSTQGTQAWDRYAFVNNNPVRYTDPTGHCPWCILTGIAGAAVLTAVVYATHPDLTPREYAATALMGFGAGFLIGTGVGAGAGIGVAATAMAVGAGTGALASAGAYAVTSGDSFSTEEMDANAIIGGVTGAATALTGPSVLAPKIAGSFWAMGARAGINAIGAEASMMVNDYYDDDLSSTSSADMSGTAVGGYSFGFLAEGADWLATTLFGSEVAGTLAYNAVRSLSVSTVQNEWLNFVDCSGEYSCQE